MVLTDLFSFFVCQVDALEMEPEDQRPVPNGVGGDMIVKEKGGVGLSYIDARLTP